MRVILRLPPALSERIGSRGEIPVEGESVLECLRAAASLYPDLGGLIWRENGQINPVIHIFHQEDLLHADDLQRRVKDADCIDVIPAIEGG